MFASATDVELIAATAGEVRDMSIIAILFPLGAAFFILYVLGKRDGPWPTSDAYREHRMARREASIPKFLPELLEDCPFCGAYVWKDDDVKDGVPTCSKCGATASTINAWDKREEQQR